MRQPSRPATSPRKEPSQDRSRQLVAAIVEAAIRVLKKDGAAAFTTIRVAEEAGVSVGSLYQYFPNKQAILFRLQTDEWDTTGVQLESIMADTRRPAADRLRDTMRTFFRSECEEAPLRQALADAAPSYRKAPEARERRRRGATVVNDFIASIAPRASASQRRFGRELIFATMSSLGKQASERELSPRELNHWADEVATMLLAYLRQLGVNPRGRVRRAPATARHRVVRSGRPG